jgi:hypothetical protein
MQFWVALPLQDAGGVIVRGDAIVSNLGRMPILPWGQSLGANVMNFAVCHVTTPVLLACFGWDNAAVTQHPVGKLVGDFSSAILDAVGS